MKANELRIGNLVEINAPIMNKIIKVDVYHISEIKRNNSFLKAILITEDWLLRLGFFITETNKCVEAFRENFRYSIQQVENSNQWFWCDGETVITNLKHVHQLQNLYFALTGTELTLSIL